jgi:CheY-like chemotaxis protein
MERPFFYLIDDDELFSRLNERFIFKLGLSNNVQTFFNAIDALEVLKSMSDPFMDAPDLILLDINMPGMNGWSFLESYSKLPTSLTNQINLFICSSTVNPDEIKRAEKHPLTSGFISKPINKETVQRIRTVLNI